ncbi:thioredoxin-disulfide reductase [Mycoplasmoides pirum]|uniref:thioredoxin-disulfide reductase n=1 Tax=Mycoplasmoides pirum TaxID=2122 RepID=UPI0004817D9D|nr:thioredoxin-disulfide reductase [Mycoplasmoides pirum]
MYTISDNKDLYDLVIIGAGPAGITAGIYAARANIKLCLVEGGAPGGKMLKTGVIENYPGVLSKTGPDLSLEMFNQLSKLNVYIEYNSVVSIEKKDEFFLIFLPTKTIFAKSIIIATGSNERAMNTPNESKFYNKGISYCAICDGSLYKNKPVAVVGGGNAAIDESIYLAGIASKVYLVHRRDEFRADSYTVDILKKYPNVEFLLSYVPHEVIGENKVNSFVIKSVKDDSLKTLSVDCIFPYIGAIPATKFINNFDIKDEAGFIKVNEQMETCVPGLYAAGDCIAKKYRQISTAINDGTIAALNVKEYLTKLN